MKYSPWLDGNIWATQRNDITR